jgi:DNA-binding NtrC family response regulator
MAWNPEVTVAAVVHVDGRFLMVEEREFIETLHELVGDGIDIDFVSHLHGVETTFAGHVPDAIVEAIRSEGPEAQVLPYLMPGGNGMNFLVRAREGCPHMQRVLVTGYMKPEMLLRSVNEAALFRYLLKPVSMPELLKVVQDATKAHDASLAAAK